MSSTTVSHEGKTLTIVTTIKAPKDKVWGAWENPEIFAKWWGPRGWETTVKHMEFKPSGHMIYGMKCNDESQGEWFGQTSYGKAVYESINPTDDFSYTDYFSDDEGNATEGMPVTKIKMTFTEADGVTTMTSYGTYESEEALNQVLQMGMEEGIKQTIDRLVEMLEK